MSTEIEARHQRQLIAMRGYLEGCGYYRALRALEVVRAQEQGFRKDNKTPKFHHQLSVARYISTLHNGLLYPEDTICAAILHDCLEDHSDKISLEDLRRDYGDRVAHAVWLLTKKTPTLTKQSEQYFGEMGVCPIASLVKAADRAHNVQTMVGVFTPEKQRRYLQEVETYFFPMLKGARRRFPEQFQSYENVKILLRCQLRLITAMLDQGDAE